MLLIRPRGCRARRATSRYKRDRQTHTETDRWTDIQADRYTDIQYTTGIVIETLADT